TLPADDASAEDSRQAFVVMNCAINLAHAGDVIKQNLLKRITAKVRSGVAFNQNQDAEIEQLAAVIAESLRLLAPALMTADLESAAALARQKDRFREAEDQIIQHHLRLSNSGTNPGSNATTSFIEMIHDLHRINSHVASSGYPVVSAAGLFKESRISGVQPS
ncbi:MAG: PhoU domain-containing protein, partial [Cypionkella sp.]